MNREQILSVYQQGPEAVVRLVEKLLQRIEQQENTIRQLQARVEQLEARTKKTVLTVIYRLLRIRFALEPPYGRKPESVQVDRSGIEAIRSKRRQSLIISWCIG